MNNTIKKINGEIIFTSFNYADIEACLEEEAEQAHIEAWLERETYKYNMQAEVMENAIECLAHNNMLY